MTTVLAHETIAAPPEAPSRDEVAVSVDHLVKRFLVRRPFQETLVHPFRREYARALNGVTCDVRRGEFFGFLGPNGAGKTTLFKILATLVSPDEGRVIVDGLDVVQQAGAVRRILTPVICDERSLRWRLSARENLNLYAVLYGVPPHKIKPRIDEILEVVGLANTGYKLVGRFSSGMKQRLLIGRALIPGPRVLLLDEPTRSLDPVSARHLRTFLREEVCRRLGCTVLLATHSADEAFELCDRVAVLNRGRIATIRPTDKLLLEFGDDRYRLCTNTPGHPAIKGLLAHGLATEVVAHPADEDGWAYVDIHVPGGLDRAAQAIGFLSERGARVARFERVRLSLGELIQRVINRQAGGDGA